MPALAPADVEGMEFSETTPVVSVSLPVEAYRVGAERKDETTKVDVPKIRISAVHRRNETSTPAAAFSKRPFSVELRKGPEHFT